MATPVLLPTTETADDRYLGLDTWVDAAVLEAFLDGQRRAIESVAPAIPNLSRAAELIVDALSGGGRLVYLAGGTPALISLGDALELPQTFGISRNQIVLLLAGGHAITHNLTGVDEDKPELGEQDVRNAAVGPADCVLATSASGSTPYTVAGLALAHKLGARTIAIASNRDAPLFQHADVAVFLDAGPEVLSGSTRMGAGTAQKAALNMLSTLVGIRLGHVHDNYMVNVLADNTKLRKRATRIIATTAGVDIPAAEKALQASGGEVKPAILLAAGAATLEAANAVLERHKGFIRSALAEMSGRAD